MENKNSLKELVYKRLKEMSATGGGASAATFTPGEGANYATPFAYNPNKKAKGTAHNYYYKLGFKPVNAEELHKKAKGIEHKDLWKKKLKEEEDTPPTNFESIEDKINTLLPLLKLAKTKTEKEYDIPSAIIQLDNLITIFK